MSTDIRFSKKISQPFSGNDKKINRRPREKLNFDTPKYKSSKTFHKFAFAVGLYKIGFT